MLQLGVTWYPTVPSAERQKRRQLARLKKTETRPLPSHCWLAGKMAPGESVSPLSDTDTDSGHSLLVGTLRVRFEASPGHDYSGERDNSTCVVRFVLPTMRSGTRSAALDIYLTSENAVLSPVQYSMPVYCTSVDVLTMYCIVYVHVQPKSAFTV